MRLIFTKILARMLCVHTIIVNSKISVMLLATLINDCHLFHTYTETPFAELKHSVTVRAFYKM